MTINECLHDLLTPSINRTRYYTRTMQRDPSEIATSLIHEHGKGAALRLALEEIIKAQSDNDNYSLSIWRDVKRILRENRT